MRKILLLFLVIFSVFLGYSYGKDRLDRKQVQNLDGLPKSTILRFAMVADSEDDNDLLTKALNQAKGADVNFVIGLGDLTSIGTVEQLNLAKKVFVQSGLTYHLTAGDHDLWDSRNRGEEAIGNYKRVFGDSSYSFNKEGIQFVILDNSDIYRGMSAESLEVSNKLANSTLSSPAKGEARPKRQNSKLTFVFAHKTPFHPQSGHVMGEQTASVYDQAERLMQLMEQKNVDGFFSGDLHFFAQFNSPGGNVKMTTVGAVNSTRNFQGPRFAIVTVYNDYSWEVEDIEIR